ncbi:hypothetical protein Taro_003848 [Colocasia esculenta]|uniref:C3H1-type domain-containing protein n=1 Tax=Colocasia esculenta TaxID=4460 RepID=A0A843TNC6_COLES|nr:hypothetical protein [Colocasia esculenta]
MGDQKNNRYLIGSGGNQVKFLRPDERNEGPSGSTVGRTRSDGDLSMDRRVPSSRNTEMYARYGSGFFWGRVMRWGGRHLTFPPPLAGIKRTDEKGEPLLSSPRLVQKDQSFENGRREKGRRGERERESKGVGGLIGRGPESIRTNAHHRHAPPRPARLPHAAAEAAAAAEEEGAAAAVEREAEKDLARAEQSGLPVFQSLFVSTLCCGRGCTAAGYSAMEGAPISEPYSGLEEPMWQLALGGGGEQPLYPERPGEPDCDFYMRTGTCGYRDRCRYNHPRNRAAIGAAAVRSGGGEYPERVGQQVCQYFMKTGTCKFGAACRFHHPRQGAVAPVQLNYHGYPLRQGEKECAYYMKTGQCKFGVTCKFHHPQSAGASVPAPAPPFYSMVQSPSAPSSHQFPTVANWQVARPPPQMPGSYVQGAYGPMILSSGMVPMSSWGPYQPPIDQAVPPGSQHAAEASSVYGLSYQLSPSYLGPYQPVSSSVGSFSSGQKDALFPERHGQPECQYYMKTGDCKYGSTCKYHHPPERSLSKSGNLLNQMGLPLRPGVPPCSFYMQHGVCKFGPSCKFDHPERTWGYSPLTSSLADMPVASFPTGFSVATLAPSSSSAVLQREFTASTSNKDSFTS